MADETQLAAARQVAPLLELQGPAMTVLLFKLAFAGIRSRLLASGLTIAIAGAAAATIVLALEVRSSGLDPWQRTFTAANGAHVLAFVPSQADARALAELPGVTERGAPVPLVRATVGPRGKQRSGGSRRPEWPHSREHARADRRLAACVRAGSCSNAASRMHSASRSAPAWRLRADAAGSSSPCSGPRSCPARRATLAATPAWPGSPPPRSSASNPIALAGAGSEALRLADPSVAAAFTERAAAGFRQQAGLYFETWQDQRDNALGDAQGTQVIVTMFTILLLIVAFVVVGILVGARASDQHREIGLLKAAGFTPRQVGAVFALESTALGLVAAALGFALGMILAPRLAAPSAETLLGSPTIAANPWHILVASCVVLPVLASRSLDRPPAAAPASASSRRSAPAPRLRRIHGLRAPSPDPSCP